MRGRFPHELVPDKQRGNARKMRSAQTSAEGLLWNVLRAHRLDGLGFRRQQPMGPYIADFVCHEARLVVEVDGATHGESENVARDLRRDRWFADRGYETLRVTNDDVRRDLAAVADMILDRCRNRTA
jgi:very-short-patch-repair endonuclease